MMNMEHFTRKRDEILEGIRFGAFSKASIRQGEPMYHYTSIGGLQGILDSKVFRATEYQFLNDEEEFFYSDELLREVIKEEFGTCAFYNTLAIAVAEYQITYRMQSMKAEDSFYVVSFSRKRDNLTLWSEFASNGCNMELLPYEMFQDYTNLRYQGFVLYDHEEQVAELKSALRMVLEHYTDRDLDDDEPLERFFDELDEQEIRLLAEPFVHMASYYGMAMKRDYFSAEEEYRLIFRGQGHEVKYRQKGNYLLPYIELELNWEQDFHALQAITLGPLNRGEMDCFSMGHYLNSKGLQRCAVKGSGVRLRY